LEGNDRLQSGAALLLAEMDGAISTLIQSVNNDTTDRYKTAVIILVKAVPEDVLAVLRDLFETGVERQQANVWASVVALGNDTVDFVISNWASTLQERAELGRTVARLGDPRPGVGLDPATGLPDIIWGEEIPAGTYTIGDNKRSREDEQPREIRITGVEVFHLARYPITNAQFQSFIDAPDWDNPDWWEGIPKSEKRFSKPEWPYANHPRERVSWYQALAFCKWLTAKLHGGLLPNLPIAPDEVEKYVLTLAHEYEWEVAARWPNEAVQERIYPWGTEFEAEKANTSEGGISQTTAVGIYPSGKNAALGLYDLSGNVWEWCRNRYDEPDGDQDPDKIDMGSGRRVVRGGSWDGNSSLARAAIRLQSHPDGRYFGLGFRVVLVLRSPSHHPDH
jgi:formylglycine-generating enzyme required for sulfatase activity